MDPGHLRDLIAVRSALARVPALAAGLERPEIVESFSSAVEKAGQAPHG